MGEKISQKSDYIYRINLEKELPKEFYKNTLEKIYISSENFYKQTFYSGFGNPEQRQGDFFDPLYGHRVTPEFVYQQFEEFLRQVRDVESARETVTKSQEPQVEEHLPPKPKVKRVFDTPVERKIEALSRLIPSMGEGNLRNIIATIVDSRAREVDDRTIFRHFVRKYHPDQLSPDDPKYRSYEDVIRILSSIYDPKKRSFVIEEHS